MLSAIRWLVTSLLFHAGLIHAGILTLRSKPDIAHLKLWALLSATVAITYLLFEIFSFVVPMFAELRCICVWGLLFMEPIGWETTFDNLMKPTLRILWHIFESVRSMKVAKSLALFVILGTLTVLEKWVEFAVTVGILEEDKDTCFVQENTKEMIEKMRTLQDRISCKTDVVENEK